MLLLVTMYVLNQSAKGKGVGSQFTTCSSNSVIFGGSSGCQTSLNFNTNGQYVYPADFPIANQVSHYVCPSSGLRIIESNGIPDHDIVVGNPNSPCTQDWQFRMPLSPSTVSIKTELPSLGVIGVAINGVAIYGPQEGGGTNAVEPDGSILDAQYWYGHAAQSGDWHYHASELGNIYANQSSFLGWAMDGFEIYGPLPDDSVLDECNGLNVNGTYRYHVRTDAQVNQNLPYCNGNSTANNWRYILGCYNGNITQSSVSTQTQRPSDCRIASTPSLPLLPPSSPMPYLFPPPISPALNFRDTIKQLWQHHNCCDYNSDCSASLQASIINLFTPNYQY